jgi:hypothetical protein
MHVMSNSLVSLKRLGRGSLTNTGTSKRKTIMETKMAHTIISDNKKLIGVIIDGEDFEERLRSAIKTEAYPHFWLTEENKTRVAYLSSGHQGDTALRFYLNPTVLF